MRPGTPDSVNDQESRVFAQLRSGMVERQLRYQGIRDSRVLDAMAKVPREQFVAKELRDKAYGDWPLPIGYGQTISQPFTVAYMVEALQLDGSEKVLEIGTGSGYGAAVLSCLAQEVHTVERLVDLGESAKLRLARLGYHNAEVHLANGTLGLAQHAPFDAIVVTAGAEALPKPYLQQLASSGRLVIPIGKPRSQTMFCFTKQGDQISSEDLGPFAFVPLWGHYGGQESVT